MKITESDKEKHQFFHFFINKLESEKEKNIDFMDKVLNLPKLPLIGCGYSNENDKNKSNKSSHKLGKILSLVVFEIDICQGENKNGIISKYSDFNLPVNISDYLNIDEVIEIDNNTEEEDAQLFFMPKNKLNFYFIISGLPNYDSNDEKGNNGNNENNYNYNDNDNDDDNNNDGNNINIINICNDEEKNNKENNKNFINFNIIPHMYYGKDNAVSLADIQNINYQKQITLFSVSNYEYRDIFTNQSKDHIDINNLRGESSGVLYQQGNLIFIPDNLKFLLDTTNNLSQFYVMITSYDQDYHSVFYFITCNSKKSKEKMEKILCQSTNMKEMIVKMKEKFYNDSYCVINNLMEMFQNSYK